MLFIAESKNLRYRKKKRKMENGKDSLIKKARGILERILGKTI